MSEPELKDNLCAINFLCTECTDNNKCVHHRNKKRCKFFNDWHCRDAVAQVQEISRYLKHIGLELSTQKPVDKSEVEKAKAEFLKKLDCIPNELHLTDKESLILFTTNKFADFCNKLGL